MGGSAGRCGACATWRGRNLMSDFQNDRDPFGTLLSPDGEARRRQILRLAVQEADSMRPRRVRRRVFPAVALAMIVGILIPYRRAPQIAKHEDSHPAITNPPATTALMPKHLPKPREIVITRIQTDAMIAARLALQPQKPT